MTRPALHPRDLPGWVIGAGDPLSLWHNGQRYPLAPDDGGRTLDALGPVLPRPDRLADALALWNGVPPAAARVFIACAPSDRAPLWRACLAALAVQRGYAAPTTRPERLLDCGAVWTFALTAEDAAILEPLWCTAAAVGLPMVWVPYPRLADGLARVPRFYGLPA